MPKKQSTSLEKFIGILFSLAICYLLFLGIMAYLDKKKAYEIEMLNKYPATTECFIISKHPYKGRDIRVQYSVGEEIYTQRRWVSSEIYHKTIVGQKFKINYCSKDPSIAIVDYNSPIN
jgi:hypothetical protein